MMAYRDWFTSWQRGEVALRGYFQPPEVLTTDRITSAERSAADLLKRVRQLEEDLVEYRQALAERYAELAVMPYKLRLELERHPPAWAGEHVKYYLRLVREYADGTTVKEISETYSGQQRREALERFEKLKKERPGIESVKDIERRAWESKNRR